MENTPAVYKNSGSTPAVQQQTAAQTSFFTNLENFEAGQRVCKMLSSSSLVPTIYQGNIANTFIALEMATRTGSSPLAVMQNLYIVHGRPGWSAQFVIAALNTCGKFSPLRFEISGEGDKRSCRAWAIEHGTGERLEGPPVSGEMAKAEGWYGKNGSKWQTMPELMLRYRAATFFGRLYAPDILMGMRTAEELHDAGDSDTSAAPPPDQAADVDALLSAAPVPGKAPTVAPAAHESVDTVTGEVRQEAVTPPAEETAQTDDQDAAQAQQQDGDPTAEYNRAMQRCIADIDSRESLSELKWWWNNHRGIEDELGGGDSEWCQAVREHLNGCIAAMEKKQKGGRKNEKYF